MKRPATTSRAPGGIADEAARAPTSLRGLLEDRELDEIERSWPDGMTSRQIVDVFETRGIRFSEATLRKYVQLGLLPRSVRVGRKGKHRGSCGLYPSHVIRRVNVVKGMMAQDRTIEEIQRSFARFKDDIEIGREGPARAARAASSARRRHQAWPPTGAASWSARSPRRSAPPASWSGASPASSDGFLPTSTSVRLNGRRWERPLLTVAERPTEEECHG